MVNASVIGCFGASPAGEQRDGGTVGRSNIFASTMYCDAAGSEGYYYDALADNHVVSVNGRPSVSQESDLSAHHPYEWTFLPTWDKGTRHLAELACTLAGGTATHAGPPYNTLPRTWGVFYNVYTDVPSPDDSAFFNTLKACGIDYIAHSVQVERSGIEGQQVSQDSVQQVQSGVVDMHQHGVTSIIDLTHGNTTKQIYSALESQGYQPEVLLSTYLYNDENAFMADQPPDEALHTFGISVRNKQQLHVADEFFYQAVEEVAPGFVWPYAPNTYYGARYDYTQLLMLASGIQMAGPHLTPESFAAGLMRTQFANPPDSHFPGRVDVGPGNHSFMDDAAVIWWNPNLQSADYQTNGGFCYLDHGKRFRLGQYPKGDPGLFGADCGV
jgi:Periplasmic binding protein